MKRIKLKRRQVVGGGMLLLLLIFLCIVSAVVFSERFYINSRGTSRVALFQLPTPGPQRTTYQNHRYGYVIIYPTDWHLSTSSDDAIVQVDYVHALGVPNPSAFDIKVFPNPNLLDAQSWWKQNQPPYGLETGLGGVSLPSGLYAYKARGVGGQSPYTVYTVAKNQVVVQIFLYSTNEQNQKLLDNVVDSFMWK